MIKIAVSGITGRMGRAVATAVANDPKTSLVLAIARSDSDVIGQPINTDANGNAGDIKITASLQAIPFNVLIDFTLPAATEQYVNECLKLRCPIVIGTTGLTKPQKDNILQAAKYIPIVLAPNMSLGVNLCYKLLQICAKSLNNDWQVSISETHHKHKKDAPSGTALEMGKVITNYNNHAEPDIQFNSTRCGEVTGEHTVLFANDAEQIEITHRALNRMAFATGAVSAAKWVVDQEPGLYSMADVISI